MERCALTRIFPRLIVFQIVLPFCLFCCPAWAGAAEVVINARTPASALEPLPFDIGGVSPGGHTLSANSRYLLRDGQPWFPIMGEFLPGFNVGGWNGVGAPKNTSAVIIDQLNREINAALVEAKLAARLVDTGVEPFLESSANLGKFVADETEKLGKVIRAANVKPE